MVYKTKKIPTNRYAARTSREKTTALCCVAVASQQMRGGAGSPFGQVGPGQRGQQLPGSPVRQTGASEVNNMHTAVHVHMIAPGGGAFPVRSLRVCTDVCCVYVLSGPLLVKRPRKGMIWYIHGRIQKIITQIRYSVTFRVAHGLHSNPQIPTAYSSRRVRGVRGRGAGCVPAYLSALRRGVKEYFCIVTFYQTPDGCCCLCSISSPYSTLHYYANILNYNILYCMYCCTMLYSELCSILLLSTLLSSSSLYSTPLYYPLLCCTILCSTQQYFFFISSPGREYPRG